MPAAQCVVLHVACSSRVLQPVLWLHGWAASLLHGLCTMEKKNSPKTIRENFIKTLCSPPHTAFTCDLHQSLRELVGAPLRAERVVSTQSRNLQRPAPPYWQARHISLSWEGSGYNPVHPISRSRELLALRFPLLILRAGVKAVYFLTFQEPGERCGLGAASYPWAEPFLRQLQGFCVGGASAENFVVNIHVSVYI